LQTGLNRRTSERMRKQDLRPDAEDVDADQ
jgi:hypothetical protein